MFYKFAPERLSMYTKPLLLHSPPNLGGSACLSLLESPTERVEVFSVDDRSLAADWPDTHHRARHHVLDRQWAPHS
jgi:hypothetical protein